MRKKRPNSLLNTHWNGVGILANPIPIRVLQKTFPQEDLSGMILVSDEHGQPDLSRGSEQRAKKL